MLPDRVTQLLTAYIDGELSSRQRRAITRLLRKSPEARNLLQKMQQDSMILRKLPRRRLRADLSKTVLTTLDLRGIKLPTAATLAPPLPERGGFSWLGVAGALLVLAGISAGSYFYFASTAPPKKSTMPSTPAAKATDAISSAKGR